MLTAYLVDDEKHALTLLEKNLQKTGLVEIIGQSTNGIDALQAMEHARPQVWFIDIDMPEITGLELAQQINELDERAFIVFTTAHQQYAIQAFELAATDYILKPVDYNRLLKTVERIAKEAALYETVAILDHQKLQVQLLGSYQVSNRAGQFMNWRFAKERELFACMLLNNTDSIARDKLIDLLWPNDSYEKAKIYLHTAMSVLRKNLKKLGIEQTISYKMESYMLNKSKLDCDVYKLDHYIAEYYNGNTSPIQLLKDITKLYQGGMLADVDYPWSLPMIREFERNIVNTLFKLTHTFIGQKQYEQALIAAQKASQIAPYEEDAYLLLMTIHIQQANLQQAFDVYKQLEQKLGELNVTPSAQAQQLLQQLK